MGIELTRYMLQPTQLTGFKWLDNVAKDLEREGYHVIFAFEEAIGFMFGTFDKASCRGLAEYDNGVPLCLVEPFSS